MLPNRLQEFRTSDSRLTYVDTGGDLPVLLFLHGAYLSHRQWQWQTLAFSEYFRVITPSLRAHGLSSRQGAPYSAKQMAQDVYELLTHLEIQQAHICGHSLGGMVALELVHAHPPLGKTLILAETIYSARASLGEAIRTISNHLLFRFSSIEWQAELFATSLSQQTPSLQSFLTEHIDEYINDPETYHSIRKAVNDFNFRQHLADLQAKTLVVLSEHNHHTHAQGKYFAEHIPNAELKMIPETGHLLNMDQPGAFNMCIRNFLGTVEDLSELSKKSKESQEKLEIEEEKPETDESLSESKIKDQDTSDQKKESEIKE